MTAPDQGVIESIAPRASLFYRSDVQREKLIAANVTQIVIVLAVAPPFHAELLDRCLAAAEEAGIPALLALNKMDLPGAKENLKALQERFPKLQIVPASAAKGEGIDELKQALATRMTDPEEIT